MDCVVAIRFTLDNSCSVNKLILLGPLSSPLPAAVSANSHARAHLVRTQGMSTVADSSVAAKTSKGQNPTARWACTAINLSLVGQDSGGLRKSVLCSCQRATLLPSKRRTLIVTGSEDAVSPPHLCNESAALLPRGSAVEVLNDVGHWHVEGVSRAVSGFLAG